MPDFKLSKLSEEVGERIFIFSIRLWACHILERSYTT